MQEEYLHYLFKNNFLPNSFETVNGEPLEVMERGYHHYDAGPDFLEGKVNYDSKVWAGHIEFHVKSSDWNKHGHQSDPNYHNVIAHFVYEYDQPIFINNYEIPTIELKSYINDDHYNHYLKFKQSKDWIPCADQIANVDSFHIIHQKEKALVGRLIRKAEIILDDVNKYKGNQHKAFWIALGKIFGGKVNAEPFAQLVDKIQPHHIAQLNYSQTEVEAYCFGLAGFLNQKNLSDNYFDSLKEQFYYQTKLFDLNPMSKNAWRFSRMRPGNFPTIRIAQFASLLIASEFNYKKLEPQVLNSLEITPSEYWQKHYNFTKLSKNRNGDLTKSFKSLMIINAYLPFLFTQGNIVSQAELKEKALEALLNIKPEQNTIIKAWKNLGISVPNAFDSQALIEQKNEFCVKSKCLQCHIGLALLQPKKG
ncbi:MAG: DUF2851 family protein [Crocinitomicaceae bacterium]